VSTKGQRLLALHLGQYKDFAATSTHDEMIGRFSMQQWLRQHRCNVVNMSVNGGSTILGLASWIHKGLFDDMNP